MFRQRKITIGAVGAVIGNVRHDVPVMVELADELEKKVDRCFFSKAPFNAIDIIIEYGDNENCLARVGRIYKKERLPVIVQLKMSELISMKKDELYKKFRVTLINALLGIGGKYNLSTDSIEKELHDFEN
jgi:hypothetical protein